MPTTRSLADLRKAHIFADEAEAASSLCKHISGLACGAIATKGCFSLAVSSGGSVQKALAGLTPHDCNWDRVHVFVVNETIGANSGYAGVMDAFASRCGCTNVYTALPPGSSGGPMPGFAVDQYIVKAASTYEALITSHPAVDKSAEGLPLFDVMLLGVGEDGGCGSIQPDSAEARATGSGKLVLPIAEAGREAVTMSIDVMRASKKVILSACGDTKKEAVKAALGGGHAEWSCPAGLLVTPDTTWYIDTASTAAWQSVPAPTPKAPPVDESPDVNRIRRGVPGVAA